MPAIQSLQKRNSPRPRGQNGRAKPCILFDDNSEAKIKCDCQRDAVDVLVRNNIVSDNINKEHVIKKLKTAKGYKGWHLILT